MPRRKRKGRASRKNKQLTSVEPEELKNAPHSFVLHRGTVGRYIRELTKDFRRVMHPFTASTLKARRKNTVKDFQSVAGLLHVTHHISFTQTRLSTYLRIARFPRGPTLTFRIHNYSLARDVVSRMKKQYVFDRLFANSPLVVLNGFSGEGHHLKLMVTSFQNMFPSINLSKVNLSDIRRCVLLNYNPASKIIDFRHYAIKVVPKGISKSVKKIVQSKVPNLSKFEDMSEFFTKSAFLSESEAEDDPNSHFVILPQQVPSRGNMVSNQSAIRVMELGPRITFQLIKVEDGLMNGEVLFHELIVKTEEEKKLIRKRRMEKMLIKAKRKKVQEQNKLKKEHIKKEHKLRSLKGMKKLETDILMKKASEEMTAAGGDEDDDDVEWYRREVGEEPSQELFTAKPSGAMKRRKEPAPWIKRKKMKPNSDAHGGGKLINHRSKVVKNFSKGKWTVTENKSR